MHAQDSVDSQLVCQAAALPRPLHAHLRVMAESRRAVVRRAHEQTIAARCASQRHSAEGGHSRVHRGASREGHALCLDQERRRDPRQHRAVRSTDTRLAGRANYSANHAVRTLALLGVPAAGEARSMWGHCQSGHRRRSHAIATYPADAFSVVPTRKPIRRNSLRFRRGRMAFGV